MVKFLFREERFLNIMKYVRVVYLGKVLNFNLLILKI